MHLSGYFAARHAQTRATSANRRLTVLRRYFHWALRERRITQDPTCACRLHASPCGCPKPCRRPMWRPCSAPLTWATPGPARPHHAGADVCQRPARDGTGHAQDLQVGLNEGVLRVMGKGNKERLVPFGEEARSWLQRYLQEARGAILAGQQTDDLFVTHRGEGMTRVMFWVIVKSGRRWRASLCPCHPTRCATPLPPTCSTTGRICAWCNCCWGMPIFRPPPSTPTWRGSGSRRCMRSTIHAAESCVWDGGRVAPAAKGPLHGALLVFCEEVLGISPRSGLRPRPAPAGGPS